MTFRFNSGGLVPPESGNLRVRLLLLEDQTNWRLGAEVSDDGQVEGGRVENHESWRKQELVVVLAEVRFERGKS